MRATLLKSDRTPCVRYRWRAPGVDDLVDVATVTFRLLERTAGTGLFETVALEKLNAKLEAVVGHMILPV